MIATEQCSQYSHMVLREIAFLALEIDRNRGCWEPDVSRCVLKKGDVKTATASKRRLRAGPHEERIAMAANLPTGL